MLFSNVVQPSGTCQARLRPRGCQFFRMTYVVFLNQYDSNFKTAEQRQFLIGQPTTTKQPQWHLFEKPYERQFATSDECAFDKTGIESVSR